MHFAHGIRLSVRRWPLVLLLYLVSLAVGALLAVPLFRTLGILFGKSGFSPDLARHFDLMLWIDMMEKGAAAFAGFIWQLLLAALLYAIWKTASQVGLIWALRGDGTSSFWEGVGRFTLKGLLLALIFALLGFFGLGILWVVLESVAGSFGEFGTYWTWVVAAPLLTVLILGTLDLMHDYARIRLVVRGKGVWDSFIPGAFWPFRRLGALILYDSWFLVGAVLWILPFWLDGRFPKTTVGSMLAALAVQQLIVFLRSGVTVAWLGSEVSFYEERAEPEAEPEHDLEPEPESETAEESETDKLAEKPEAESETPAQETPPGGAT